VRPGPTVIATAGIHGNEQAGVEAVRRVFSRLSEEGIRGSVVFLAGNLAALEGRTRFVDLDLNRQWTAEQVRRVLRVDGPGPQPSEYAEQRALIDAIRSEILSARGPLYFVDMHTSSAEGPPFVTIGDTLLNRDFSRNFPLPVILGLEEQVDGSLLEYLNNHGIVTLGVEAGQHDAASSIDRLEAVLWIALVAAGAIDATDVAGLEAHRSLLRREARGIPRVIEVRYRHAIEPSDRFAMNPGFRNFNSIRKGQLLAQDSHGKVLAPETGLILLPLYQGKGNDGFFVAREVRPLWLKVSTVMRRLRLDRMLHLLPGVTRHPQRDDTLVADTQITRVYPLEVFHLMGFRKLRRDGPFLTVARRKHDYRRPPRIDFPAT
jgi:succinylglutamate desuccinylase